MSQKPDAPDLAGPPVTKPASRAPETGPLRPLSTPRARPLRRRRASLTFLKVALPVIVVATVVYLIYWWWVQASERVITVEKMQGVDDQPETKSEVTVSDVKYDGKDDKGRPFSITAVTASHIDGDDRHISLKKPLADIIMSGGAYVAVTALEGVLDRDADVVTLTGDVTLFHDNGLSFQTDSATVDLKEKTAEGSDPVEGQNGDGELFSEGFRVTDDGDTIVFTGKAYMKIYPKQKTGADNGAGQPDPAQPGEGEQGQVEQGQGG